MYVFERTKGETPPVTLEELREWNYIEDHQFDSKLTLCLNAGVAQVESYVNGIVWPSTFALSLDGVVHEIPFGEYPVNSITVTVDGVQLDDSLVTYDGRVIRIDGSVTGASMSVSVSCGDAVTDGDIKAAILLVASELFRNPTDSVRTLPTASQNILNPHRRANI